MISAPAAEARCALHPEVPAVGACARCGLFCCERCVTPVFGVGYCPACAALPEVNYLETFRRKCWGRRDVWAWLLGAWAVGCLGWAGVLGSEGRWGWAVTALVFAGLGGACFLGQGWARHAQFFLSLFFWGFVVLGDTERLWPTAGMGVGVAIRIYLDSRHRLFFRQPVSQKDLRRLWNLSENNPLARVALSLGVLGVLMPPAAPVALVLGAVALGRVNPEARPPVGRRGQALGGLVLGAVSILLWGGLLLMARFLLRGSGID